MQREKWQKFLPYIIAIVLYASVSYGYFAPQREGRVLHQHDVEMYEGMTQDILECRKETGEDPQWTGAMFSGMPAYLINVAYPAQIVKKCFTTITSVLDTPAGFIFFAMLAMFLMLVMMGVNSYVAIVGGLMYGLSTYFFLIIEAGHITKMWALVYAPLMMGGVYMGLKGNMLWGAALAALFGSAQIGANHPQITYYFGLAILALYISEFYFARQERRLRDFGRRTGLLAIAGLLAVMSNFSPLWYTYEHTPETMRGGSVLKAEEQGKGLDMEYATAWSYGKVESINMLVPDFVGGASMDNFSDDGEVARVMSETNLSYIRNDVTPYLSPYWGGQSFTGGPTYIGAVVILLAIFGLTVVKGRQRWWILSITLLMMLLALGRNLMWFTELAFKILPGYDKFRTVSMTLTVVEWTLPLLAALALAKVWKSEGDIERQKMEKRLLWSAGSLVVVLLGLYMVGSSIFEFGAAESAKSIPEIVQYMLYARGLPLNSVSSETIDALSQAVVADRVSIMQASTLRTLFFVVVTAGAVFLALRKVIRREWLMATVALLVVVDMVPVARKYLNSDDFMSPREAQIQPTELDKWILEDTEPGYRVFNKLTNPFNDATTSYFHRSVGGYHGAKLSRYQDIIDYYLNANLRDSSANMNVLNMLNARYIIQVDANNKLVQPLNSEAFGAAWFVSGADFVSSPQEEIMALGATSDLKSTAIIERGQSTDNLKFGAGDITLTSYQPNHLIYNYTAAGAGTVVFSEIYYDKGWRAYIDGVEAPYFRANYLLRAMEVPGGEHTIEWRFKAPRWTLIEGITLTASLIILLSIVLLIIAKIYERRKKIKA